MNDYPAMLAQVNQTEPVPRRIRAFLAGEAVFDTSRRSVRMEWRTTRSTTCHLPTCERISSCQRT